MVQFCSVQLGQKEGSHPDDNSTPKPLKKHIVYLIKMVFRGLGKNTTPVLAFYQRVGLAVEFGFIHL